MDDKTIKCETYNLHLIKTNKFKTILFKLIFRDDIKKEEITIRNVLIDYLMFASNDYKTKKDLSRKKQDLYGASLYGYNKRIGNHHVTEISLSILNPRYTEEIMFDESTNFLKQIILNPLVKNNTFDSEILSIIKKSIESDIKEEKENPDSYASIKLKEMIAINAPFSYNLSGYLKDLEKINCDTLYEYYKKFIKENIIDFYIVGDFDISAMENKIKEEFKFDNNKKELGNIKITYDDKKELFFVEESKFNQTKLMLGCVPNNLTKKEQNSVLTLYNIILGNSPESKFFKNIREKNSYAYSISSGFRKTDNLMIISSGISYKNHKKVINLIKQEMKEMLLGNFSEEELLRAKELYISVLKDIDEYQSSIIDYFFGLSYIETQSIKKQIKTIKLITKEEIINVASKINIAAIYILKEGKENEAN